MTKAKEPDVEPEKHVTAYVRDVNSVPILHIALEGWIGEPAKFSPDYIDELISELQNAKKEWKKDEKEKEG